MACYLDDELELFLSILCRRIHANTYFYYIATSLVSGVCSLLLGVSRVLIQPDKIFISRVESRGIAHSQLLGIYSPSFYVIFLGSPDILVEHMCTSHANHQNHDRLSGRWLIHDHEI